MQIALGQSVLTADGQKVGVIDRIVLNPAGQHVEQIIVHKGFLFDVDRVITPDEIDRVDASAVHLALTAEEASELPRFDQGLLAGEMAEGYPQVIPGPAQGFILFSPAPAGGTYQDNDRYFSLEPLEGTEQRPDSAFPDGDIVIGKGADVYDSEGQRVGQVHEMAYDEKGVLASLVIRAGVVRHHDLTVDAAHIAELRDNRITLNVGGRDLISN